MARGDSVDDDPRGHLPVRNIGPACIRHHQLAAGSRPLRRQQVHGRRPLQPPDARVFRQLPEQRRGRRPSGAPGGQQRLGLRQRQPVRLPPPGASDPRQQIGGGLERLGAERVLARDPIGAQVARGAIRQSATARARRLTWKRRMSFRAR